MRLASTFTIEPARIEAARVLLELARVFVIPVNYERKVPYASPETPSFGCRIIEMARLRDAYWETHKPAGHSGFWVHLKPQQGGQEKRTKWHKHAMVQLIAHGAFDMKDMLANQPGHPKGVFKLRKSTYAKPVVRILGKVAALTTGGSGSKADGRNVSKRK